MNKYIITIGLLSLFLWSCKSDSAVQSNKPPNVVIVVTDDAGYSDYSMFGSNIATPNIDALASKSYLFPNFYNNGRCSPTRASLLTGHYPHKVGVGELSRPSNETKLPGYLGYLSPDYPTFPELLKPLGYHTVMSGKWHLGGQIESGQKDRMKWPTQRGFDSFFGILGGTVRTHFKPSDSDRYIYDNERIPVDVFTKEFYSSNAIVDHAIETIIENKQGEDKPIFMYLPFFAPHLPLEGPQELVDKYQKIYSRVQDLTQINQNRLNGLKSSGFLDKSIEFNTQRFKNSEALEQEEKVRSMATHAAMIENLDSNIGRLIETLKKNGELDNTIFIVFSDNGVSANGVCDFFNAPYYGRKGMLWEGGIKTPLIISWPSKLKGKRIIRKAWHVMDIMPTILDILGEKQQVRQLTGRSFKSELLSDNEDSEFYLDREYLFWSDKELITGINKEGYKWHTDGRNRNFLFNLKIDPTERNDLAMNNPGMIREFRSNLRQYKLENNVEAYKKVLKNRLSN